MTRVIKVLRARAILLGELGSLPASVLARAHVFSPSTEASVELERIVREIARVQDEIEKLKQLGLAAH